MSLLVAILRVHTISKGRHFIPACYFFCQALAQHQHIKYRYQPKLTQKQRYEKQKEDAEMQEAIQGLQNDPEALDQLISEEQDLPFDIIHQPREAKTQAYREDRRKRDLIKRKIIERKYFRSPPEINLLTWRAKEQIRYLNSEFPEEWTPERLASSFPISREGVIKLLKSQFVPNTTDEVVKHDKRVVENWKLLNGGRHEGTQAERKRQILLGSNALERLSNFGGASTLPRPSGENENQKALRFPTKGVFASIVSDMNATTLSVSSYINETKLDADAQISKIASGFIAEIKRKG